MKHPDADERYDVFISYRHQAAAAEARLVRADLIERGLHVFMDVTDLGRGFFDDALLTRIAQTRNFVILLSPGSLDRAADAQDWMRNEVRQAILSRCNIVPVMLPGFAFPPELLLDIQDLARYQGVEYSHVFFDATMNRLVGLLQDLPHGIKQPRHEEPGSRRSALRWTALSAGAAALVAGAILMVRYEMQRPSPARILNTVAELRRQYRQAIVDPPSARAADLARAQADVDKILKVDARNGHGLYYAGEILRMSHPALFSDSCVIPSALRNDPAPLNAYEQSFFNYLDVESSLPADQTQGGYSAELCYARPEGYCPQRTAWIYHVLANDLYQEGLLAKDETVRTDDLTRALHYAQNAESLYQDPDHNPGFAQCVSTRVLIHSIQSMLPANTPGS